jgi:hypothetical protein
MGSSEQVNGQIQATRAAAARARRIVLSLASDEDKRRVLAFAAELDAQADALEKQARADARADARAVPMQAVTRPQRQMQQHRGTPKEPSGSS